MVKIRKDKSFKKLNFYRERQNTLLEYLRLTSKEKKDGKKLDYC